MVRLITINVVNATQSNKAFFFYLGQAQYSVSGPTYSQSLTTATVAPLNFGGSFTLQIPFDYCAAAQKVGVNEFRQSAIQPIALSAGSSSVKDSTQMSINPVALAPPVPNGSVPVGAFEIVVPSYDSNSQNYYVGTGLQSQSGLVVLTSYILATPSQCRCDTVDDSLCGARHLRRGSENSSPNPQLRPVRRVRIQ
jgi:hypothetical protein